jgi:hypothetical protein
MDNEIEYLAQRISDLQDDIQRDIDYGYTGERIEDQLHEVHLLENILENITQ